MRFRLFVFLERRFKRLVLDAFAATGEACFLRRTILLASSPAPDPGQPPRRVPRPDPPVVCPCFGLEKLEHRVLVLCGVFSSGLLVLTPSCSAGAFDHLTTKRCVVPIYPCLPAELNRVENRMVLTLA